MMNPVFENACGAVFNVSAFEGAPAAEAGGTRDYADFAATIRRELAPASLIERVLVERVSIAAWRLFTAGGLGSTEGRELARAERTLGRTFDLLGTTRTLLATVPVAPPRTVGPFADQPVSEGGRLFIDDDPSADFGWESNESPIVPRGRAVSAGDTEAEVAPESESDRAERWQDRLVFDFNVSDRSPVVKGTWITVSHVVTLIVDGWSWPDILRTHPELTEEDVRTCLAYTVAHDPADGDHA